VIPELNQWAVASGVALLKLQSSANWITKSGKPMWC